MPPAASSQSNSRGRALTAFSRACCRPGRTACGAFYWFALVSTCRALACTISSFRRTTEGGGAFARCGRACMISSRMQPRACTGIGRPSAFSNACQLRSASAVDIAWDTAVGLPWQYVGVCARQPADGIKQAATAAIDPTPSAVPFCRSAWAMMPQPSRRPCAWGRQAGAHSVRWSAAGCGRASHRSAAMTPA